MYNIQCRRMARAIDTTVSGQEIKFQNCNRNIRIFAQISDFYKEKVSLPWPFL